MSMPKDKVIISVSVDSKVKELLVKSSKDLDIPLSRFARNLIYVALDDFKLLKKAGLITVLKFFRDSVESYIKHEGIREALFVTKDEKPVTISVVVSAEVKEDLDKYSEYLGLPLNIFGRNLIYVGLDEFEILRKAGFGKLHKMIAGFKDFVRTVVNEYSTNRRST